MINDDAQICEPSIIIGPENALCHASSDEYCTVRAHFLELQTIMILYIRTSIPAISAPETSWSPVTHQPSASYYLRIVVQMAYGSDCEYIHT